MTYSLFSRTLYSRNYMRQFRKTGKLNTYKIDVSNKTIEEIVKEIIKVGDEND